MSSGSGFAAGLLAAAARQAGPGPGVQPCQRGVVEDMGRGVAHFFHRQTDTARFLVQTLVTPLVGSLADAWNERQRALQDANYLANRDISRFSREHVTTATTELALQQAMACQLEKDGLEKLLWQLLAFGKLGCLNGTLA